MITGPGPVAGAWVVWAEPSGPASVDTPSAADAGAAMMANIHPIDSTVAIRRIHRLRFMGFVTIVFILPPVVVAEI
jgi:hypothetical protein